MKILIIDDEPSIRLALGRHLKSLGHQVFEAATGSDGAEIACTNVPEVVLLDHRLPDMLGDQLLPMLLAADIGAKVIMMTAYGDIENAVAAMKKGAEHFFAKPVDLDQVTVVLGKIEERIKLQREVESYRMVCQLNQGDEIIGHSPAVLRVKRLISLLAVNRETPVLVQGESGTGKELAAKAIHRLSGVKGPFVELNCASLSENLLESELFGHEKGAFTDARAAKPGLFELANDGTIFFDEVAETPLSVQAKLLKVLDSKIFRRVGGVVEIKSSARIIAASNRDLPAAVRRGEFREDLLYRLNVLPVIMPPLRDRGNDVSILAEHLAKNLGLRMGRKRVVVSPEAHEVLRRYSWPGNVRELRNAVERAMILATDDVIGVEHLPPDIMKGNDLRPSVSYGFKTLQEVEQEHIRNILLATNNNHSRTASILGISRSTLIARLKRGV